jgi:mannose-1-phosphate guanylyltransferase
VVRPRQETRQRISEEVPFSAGLQAGVIPMLPVVPRAKGTAAQSRRWGVILAGGDGTRLRSVTRFICGDNRPKQFCPLFDGRTLLGQTVRRAQRSIPTTQTLFALTHTHRDFYAHELDGFQSQRIIQPANKGTAPPILFSALSIAGMDENALMAVLPSDHHYSDEPCFTAALESAFAIAAKRPESVVLIGAHPSRPEVEYGWIELGASVGDGGTELLGVRGFWEKPSLEMAETLLRKHSAWNTFVMVGHVRAFMDMVARAIPDVLEAVRQARLWTGSETHIGDSVYDRVPPSDFSRHVLSVENARLLVLRVRDLGWSDLGHPGRVLAVLESSRSKPRWLNKWRQAKPAAIEVSPEANAAVA